MLSSEVKGELEKKSYGIFNHSGVEICEWTKKALRNEGTCYKSKFYNVHTHRCMQFSPTVAHCNQNCLFCWRPNEMMYQRLEGEINSPEEIIEKLVPLRNKLLMGFKGNEKVPREVFREALVPDHFAISLSGEPTLYSMIIDMIDYLCKRARSVFLVTNGSSPEVLRKLKPHKNFQLYISCNAPNEEVFRKICRPISGLAWEKFLESLDAMRDFKGRRVLRLTFIRDMNDSPELVHDYRELIKRSGADFVEVKSFMSIGYSRKRLPYEKMLSFPEVKEIAERLLKGIDYKYENEQVISRIVLLKRKGSRVRNWFD